MFGKKEKKYSEGLGQIQSRPALIIYIWKVEALPRDTPSIFREHILASDSPKDSDSIVYQLWFHCLHVLVKEIPLKS